MKIVLISCYELGHQPLAVASAAGFLARAGFTAECIDLAVDHLDEPALASCAVADLVAISIPMHTAFRLGLAAARRIRAASARTKIVFFGLYAPLHEEILRTAGADHVLGGECEEALIDLVRGQAAEKVTLRRLAFGPPVRDALPPLARYARLVVGSERRVAGYVEATRGCKHLCRHCPIPAVYDGRFFAVPVPLVVDDALAQVQAGARHITFGDPDFLNGPRHALAVARAFHAAAPTVTFDFTAKVSHLVAHADLLPEFAALGCLFVISAIESLSPRVLDVLAKGHTAAEAQRAVDLARAAGLSLRPTWLPFTPWATLADYLEICRFLADNQLEAEVDPVQLSLRLLVPPGSLLLGHHDFGPLDPDALTHTWTHPDPRMDRLCDEVQELVERSTDAPAEQTFAAIYAAAARVAGTAPLVPRPRATPAPPRLSEPWFCCAEPTRRQTSAVTAT